MTKSASGYESELETVYHCICGDRHHDLSYGPEFLLTIDGGSEVTRSILACLLGAILISTAGCGGADVGDIPELDPKETEQKNAEMKKTMEEAMKKQAAGQK